MPAEPKTPTKLQRRQPYPTPTSHSKSDKSIFSSKRSSPPSPSKVIHIEDNDGSPSPTKPVEVDDSEDENDAAVETADDAPYSPPGSISDDSDGGSEFEPESDEDIKPAGKGKSKAAKSSSFGGALKAAGATKATQERPRAHVTGGGGAKGTAWTAEQDWALFQARYPKAAVKWQDVAKATGRDAKSCSNRDALLTKKLPGLIKGLGNN